MVRRVVDGVGCMRADASIFPVLASTESAVTVRVPDPPQSPV